MEVKITKLWNFTATFRPKSNSTMCHEALTHPSHQEVKSCKTLIKQNFTQSDLFQPGHEPRPDLHTALEPGSEILQDPKSSKSCNQLGLFQSGHELRLDLHTGHSHCKDLEFSMLHIVILYM